MRRLVLPFVTTPSRRSPVPVRPHRAVLEAIRNDLQILALERPRALELVAVCVHKLAQPVRDRLARRAGR